MKKINLLTIEDCLEIITGVLISSGDFSINSTDISIMTSIARQTGRGIALTDRQQILILRKLEDYRSQFIDNNYTNFDHAVKEIRLPLREIDRSKYIKLVYEDLPNDKFFKPQGPYVKIRFPFRKSLVALIIPIAKANPHWHEMRSHDYYFQFNEQVISALATEFKNKDFDIDDEIDIIYKKMQVITANREKYVSSITGNILNNIHPRALKLAQEELGEFSASTELHYVDRCRRYGIVDLPKKDPVTLCEKIAYRTSKEYHSKPTQASLGVLLDAICTLDRLPLLIILEKSNAKQQLYETLNYYRDIVPAPQQSVLFRLEGGSEFNDLVKDRKVNNWVDKDTKIVYVSADKLPKLLVGNIWTPNATISFSSKLNRLLNTFIEHSSDLIVFREEDYSLIRKYSSYYG